MSHSRISSRAKRGTAVALALVAIGAAGAGTANAYWSGRAAGTGGSSTGTVTLAVTTAPLAGLYPGGNVAVSVTLKNTTSGNLTVTSLTQSGTATIQTTGKGSCNPAVVTFAVGALPSGALTPGQSGTATGTVSMTTAAADGCQGTTFVVPLTGTAHL
ncbi:MAG TPA: hypothetical protein VG899_17065 [Mycobacteriales bacterium]|nr:hypothetical protein [Mycobacteriales bacterium]